MTQFNPIARRKPKPMNPYNLSVNGQFVRVIKASSKRDAVHIGRDMVNRLTLGLNAAESVTLLRSVKVLRKV